MDLRLNALWPKPHRGARTEHSAVLSPTSLEVDCDFKTGFLQPFFERAEFSGQFVDLTGAEFREDEFVQPAG